MNTYNRSDHRNILTIMDITLLMNCVTFSVEIRIVVFVVFDMVWYISIWYVYVIDIGMRMAVLDRIWVQHGLLLIKLLRKMDA